MIYQHATRQRDRTIADALSVTIAAERVRARKSSQRNKLLLSTPDLDDVVWA
jgi:hypothetical protein